VADRLAQVAADAPRLAQDALAVLQQAYPHRLDHLILDAGDRPLPSEIHPVFDGCYDWHSSVHMHWSLLRLWRTAPELPLQREIEAHVERRFSADNVARELAYAAAPGRAGFERPYGWAWLLKLQSELDRHQAGADGLPGAGRWAEALRPLSGFFALRFAEFIGRSHYPVRAGMHANSAFAMGLALEYADAQLVHLDGLNLSRAWCLQTLARALPHHAAEFERAAQHHWQAAWPHVFGGDFVATHWLLSFALLSLDWR